MFKYIFIVIIILILIPQVRRWLFWMIVGKQLMKEQKKRQSQYKSTAKKKDDVNIDYVPGDGKKDGFKGGEYVDYEEVKD
ncbi:MAG: UPF0716 family protein affecting phage T7 exclusion [Spirosomataceae bacterium]|jgi:UPF0716 family protein affecting phage T7 exclusion